MGQIGRVEVDPNTQLQLLESRGREHRLALARGTIHARIWAPPKFFYVNTPSAVAVDLGCAYSLQVDDSGAGLLRVTAGWVAFETDGRESFIPAGAVCVTRPGVGPGTPRYEDAPSGYAEALATLDFGAADDPGRAAALDLLLSQARRRDALTLWHLLGRGTLDERARVYDRMAVLAPPPTGVTREAVLRGDRAEAARWWDSLGLDGTTWWRIRRKSGDLHDPENRKMDGGGCGCAQAVAIQFVRPARTNPSPIRRARSPRSYRITPAAAAVLERSCRDCHSNDTRWPWYSNVAPVSWWVIDHVDHGRSHLNFSDWSRYDAPERAPAPEGGVLARAWRRHAPASVHVDAPRVKAQPG